MKFPSKLNIDSSPFIKLINYTWVAQNKASQISSGNKDTEDFSNIYLPAPISGLTVSDNHTWEQQNNLMFDKLLSKEVGSKILQSIFDKGKGDAIANYEHYQKGEYVKTYDSLMYNGIEMREFTFEWNFTPESKEDNIILHDMIYYIRQRCMPVNTNGMYNSYPDFWEILISFGGGNTDLLKIINCVATNVTVNYSPDGNLNVFYSGHPTQVNLSITFKELVRDQRSSS